MFAQAEPLRSDPKQIGDYFTATKVCSAFGLFAIYVVSKVFYRLYLSPLSRIPGRKLAGKSSFALGVFCDRYHMARL